MEIFGELLKGFRKRRNLNQQGLAKKLGVHRNTVSDWERSNYVPENREMVLAIANVLLLSKAETDELLFSANYPLEYQSKDFEKASVAHFKEVMAETIYVGQVKVADGPASPHSPRRCDFYQHISMPQNFVERKEVMKEVREALLSDTSALALTSTLQYTKPNALHGMGGIGKSVIARILCDDPKVQERFPDGILWVALGQTPELVPKMRDWVNALGGTIAENAPTVDSLKVSLAKLLENRTCLLILDDVWQFAHAEVFRIGGPDCRLLLTTRDAEIAYKLGAKIQSVPVMIESEAVTLLEKWADGQINEVGLELKKRIVKRLGYLPLAVELTGAQLRRKHPEMWLHSFAIDKLKAPRADPRNIHDSLELTFRLSLNELHENARGLYVALAIFKEDEAISQRGIEKLWQELSGLDSDGTTDLLDDLASRALLQIDHLRKVELHDLLRDFIASELKDRQVETHQILLSAYRTAWRGKGWHTADDDGYIYDHLAYHLHAIGAIAELKGLFADQQWLHKRVPQRDYTYDGYLSDLTLAWEYAEAEARHQIEICQEPSAFADCIRYLLICTSINSIAGNYIPELVVRAVGVGVWTPFRVLSVAAKIPGWLDRLKMYKAILETVGLSNEQKKEVQRLEMGAALAIEDERQRAEALTELALQLTGEQRTKMLEKALETALAMKYESLRAEALTELVPQLTGEQRTKVLERALEAALAIEDEMWRVRVLIELVPQLTGEPRTKVLEKALEAALAIKDERWRVEALTKLAPQLTGELVERALEAALAIEGEWWRAEALTELVPQLTGELVERALEAALAMKDERWRVEALIKLAPQLTGEQHTKVLERALEAALDIEDARWRAEALTKLAPQLTGELVERALEAALAIEGEWNQVRVLTELVSQLTGEQHTKVLEKALEAALAMKTGWKRAEALTELVPQLTGELLEQALEAALAIEGEWNQVRVLTELVSQLTGEQHTKVLERAFETALAMKDESDRAEALTELALQLTGEQRTKVLEKALETALAIKTELWRAEALTKLVPQLTGELVERALEAALAIKDERQRAEALTKLVPQLTGELVERALEAALAIKDEWNQVRALTGLALQLTGEQRTKVLEKALEAALDIEDERNQVWALTGLAPQLTGEQRTKVLEKALAIEFTHPRVRVMTKLAPQLTGEQRTKVLEKALEAALAMQEEMQRVEALTELAPQLTGEQRTKVLEKALETALAMKDEWRRAEALTELAPQLTGEQRTKVLEKALEAALAIKDERWRARALTKLAPQLTGEQRTKVLEKALGAALAMKNEWRRAEALTKLAPQLTGEQRTKVLERALGAALAIKDEGQRAEVLTELVPQLTGELLERALEAVLAMKDEWNQVRVLTELVPQLTGELVERVLEAALAMKTERGRAEMLATFLSGVSDQTLLLQSIWKTMMQYSMVFRSASRASMLDHFFIDSVLITPIYSIETLEAFASQIVEICREWIWL